MGSKIRLMATRVTWLEICRSDAYRGRWVALDNVRYAQGSSQPVEAEVVDADEDLADLCARMRESNHTACAIVFVDEDACVPVSVRRPFRFPPRAAQH